MEDLVAMGFDRDSVVFYLNKASGDQALAVSWLLQQSEKEVQPRKPLLPNGKIRGPAVVDSSNDKNKYVGRTFVGTVVSWDDQKGFGFLSWEHPHNVFLHMSDLVERRTIPQRGDSIRFTYAQNTFHNRGYCAKNAEIVQAEPQELMLAPLPRSLRSRGRIKRMEAKYGFIIPETGPDPLIFFFRALLAPGLHLASGDAVEYDLKDEPVIGHSAVRIAKLSRFFTKEQLQHQGREHVFVYGTTFHKDEDRENEFKSLLSTKPHTLPNTIQSMCSKYLNAFLNTQGGTIYFGILDNGVIAGLVVDRSVRDLIRRAVDHVMHHHTPSVESSLYKIQFIEVYEAALDGYFLLEDRYIVAVRVEKGKAPVYSNGERVAFIRRDGSTFQMKTDEVLLRTQEFNEEKKIHDERALNEKVQAAIAEALQGFRNNSNASQTTPGASPSLPAASPSSGDFLDEKAISELTSFGYQRAVVIETLYDLKREGANINLKDPVCINAVLDRLLSNPSSVPVFASAPAPAPAVVPSAPPTARCPHCNDPVPSAHFDHHVNFCPKAQPLVSPPLPSPSPPSPRASVGIPCEFCEALFSFESLFAHQRSCPQRR